MNHEEIEIEVSKLVNPGPWKHESPYNRRNASQPCIKCGDMVNTHEIMGDCPVPDPYPIPLTREGNEDRYDLVMGRAVAEFRKHVPKLTAKVASIIELVTGFFTPLGQSLWLNYEATPAQLWSIVIKAKEKK